MSTDQDHEVMTLPIKHSICRRCVEKMVNAMLPCRPNSAPHSHMLACPRGPGGGTVEDGVGGGNWAYWPG